MDTTGMVLEAHARDGCSNWKIPGIVVAGGRDTPRSDGNGQEPRIAAFIWGGKVRPSPTLPYGRWKGAA